ncbi:MAG: DUF503 domain-containing protein [Chloroflexota bacterium]
MHVATCQIQLSLEGIESIKDKRRIIKSVTKRLSNEFNIAIAEVDHQDVWYSTVIGVAAVGNSAPVLNGVLENVISWLERNRPDLELVQYHVEFR